MTMSYHAWLRGLIITALLAAVTYLFMQSNALDPARHLATLRAMNALNRVDAELSRNLLLARSGLLLHYDPINQAIAEFHRELDALPFADAGASSRFPDAIVRRFDSVRANAAYKDDLVERFKSMNALIRNSWAYFTERSHAIGRQSHLWPESGEFTATIGELSPVMLRVSSDPVGETGKTAAALLNRLETSPVPPTLKLSLNSLVRHGRLILNLSRDLDGILRDLLTSPTGALIDDMRNAYLEYHHVIEKRAKNYRTFLYVLSVLLLVYLVYLFYRLQAGARTLSRVNEGLMVEIAERKHAEHEARERQTELAHVHRLSTMGEMATGLAHELNQPLAAITSYAQGCVQRLRSEKAKPDEILDAIDKISAEAKRAAGIIRRMRSFVRKEKPRLALVDVNAAIRETADLLGAEAHKHGAAIELHLTDSLPTVMADQIQVQQTVLNLMRNGMEAMGEDDPAPRRLSITTSINGNNEIEVAVADTGHGVPPQTLEHIFDPFFTTKARGLGLGLPICRSIIETHGGRMWVTGNASGGTIFHFSLPIVDGGNDGNA